MISPRAPLFRSRLLWLGFALAAVGQSLCALNYYRPAVRSQCGGRTPLVYPLVAIADSAAQCPKGTHGHQYTGYDRWLCVRYPDGS